MEWDRKREEAKRAELLRQLCSALSQSVTDETHATRFAEAILDACITTRPPEAAGSRIYYVTLGTMGQGGGASTKPGNIRLNLGKLMEAVASSTLAAVSATQAPWTAPFAALVIWTSLWRAAEVPVSETEAGVLYVMWLHKNEDRDVLDVGLLQKCNAMLHKYGRPPLSSQQLNQALRKLSKIGTIERSPRGPELWWLREWVRVAYR